jgi:phenylacetate-CoA ligase
MLNKLIYKTGVFLRNSKINEAYNSLLETEFQDLSKLEENQLIKLKEIVANAYQGSLFYKKHFDKAGFKVEDLKSLEDIKRLPTINKNDLLNNTAEIQIPVSKEKSYYSETSGSTGEPLIFYRNQEWDAWHNASVFRGYHWHGINPWDRNGYLWGFNFSFSRLIIVKIQDYLQNRFRLFNYDEKELTYFCKKLSKAKYLNGYSSMIYELSRRINQNPKLKVRLNLKLVKGTSEKIYDSYQESVIEAFGSKMVSEYGAAEAGIIAFECDQGLMHVNMETCIVEEVDNKILVTNLYSKSFPIIRYELGDYIKLNKDLKCQCGKNSHIITEVTGRIGKNIYGISNVYPSLTLYYIFKNIAIKHDISLNYQVLQKVKGQLILMFEKKLTEEEKSHIDTEIAKYFSTDISYTLEEGQALFNQRKKKVDFISEIE